MTERALAGAELAAWDSGPADGEPLLAIHGVTASHLAWRVLARHLPDRRLITPDLRGRGRSRDLGAPYGLRQHAADLETVLDAAGVERTQVVGHSMGAFVAVALAARAPDRVSSLVLVDGGVPLESPPGITPERLPEVVLGPAMERLSKEFPTTESYRAFWQAHPAFQDGWTADVEAYVDADLVGEPPALRPATVADAVRTDTLDLYGAPWYLEALLALRIPVTILRAPRGLLDEPGGLYQPGRVETVLDHVPWARIVEVLDVNHYTILMSEAGAGAVAGNVRSTASIHDRRSTT